MTKKDIEFIKEWFATGLDIEVNFECQNLEGILILRSNKDFDKRYFDYILEGDCDLIPTNEEYTLNEMLEKLSELEVNGIKLEVR